MKTKGDRNMSQSCNNEEIKEKVLCRLYTYIYNYFPKSVLENSYIHSSHIKYTQRQYGHTENLSYLTSHIINSLHAILIVLFIHLPNDRYCSTSWMISLWCFPFSGNVVIYGFPWVRCITSCLNPSLIFFNSRSIRREIAGILRASLKIVFLPRVTKPCIQKQKTVWKGLVLR